MMITTALSLFLLFWCTLFFVDLYLRSNQNEKYLAFVERRGFSFSPFQIRFYVNRPTDHGGGSSSLSFMRTWSPTASQRAQRTLLGWFSVGALVGLVCFAVTPLYLTWLLAVELGNVWRLLRWRGGGLAGGHPLAAFLPISTLAPLEQEDVNFRVAISDLNSPDSSLFYIPLQEHVQTGITPVIPGVNIPWSDLPLFMFVLIVAGVFHELGHAIAAINANVRLNGFGVFLFAVYPGAFTELETEELNRSSSAQKLRIYTAGIWHNIILAFFGILIIWCAPIFFALFYETGRGVVITDVSDKSGLYGENGFQPGHIVTQINQCPVSNSTEWTQCLERMHNRQVAGAPKIIPLTTATGGYLVQYAKVVPLTASTANVYDTTQSGEVQCCAEFGNVSPSHICFRYYPTLAQMFKPADGGGGENVGEPPTQHRPPAESGGAEAPGRRANRIPLRVNDCAETAPEQNEALNENVVPPPPAGNKKSAVAVVESPPSGEDGQLAAPEKNDSPTIERAKTSPAPKFADSLGLKKLVKRSVIPQKLEDILLDVPPVEFVEKIQDQPPVAMAARSQSPSGANVLNVERSKKELLERVVRHACLPARKITDHAACEQMDEYMNLKRVPPGYVCVTPALYNGTALLRFELKNRSRPVLFVGFLSEPLYMIDLMDITPRFEWIPYWIPFVVELFGKYLLTFSLAMALLNAVPCYGLDGQFMCETVVNYFWSRRPVEERQKICSRIITFGTAIFSLNVAIGLMKFLVNYSR